jgi:23S rRNA (cytosine1962-C5)-methyltransferase
MASRTMAPDAIAIVGARGAARWQRGHPWIFRSDVQQPPDAAAGVVKVTEANGRPLGSALWSPASEISLRLLERDAQVTVDAAWWAQAIERAVARRHGLSASTNAFRLVHAEGDGLPSLVVDRYDRWLVVQLLSAGLEQCRDDIVAALLQSTGADGILARNDAPARGKEGLVRSVEVLHGTVPDEIKVREGDVHYMAAPRSGQKTGAFLDQRENRLRIGELARGRALDCFSYHGSFALHLARHADTVIALDSSAEALARARENASLNGYSNIEFVEADAFVDLRERERRRERFDTIVVDPPAFAKSKSALGGAIRGYHEINLRAMRLLAPGGLMFTASCSFHLTRPRFLEMLEHAAEDSGRRIVLRALYGQSGDHPELLTVPETGYLKGALLEATD